jgi:hypothetical protein
MEGPHPLDWVALALLWTGFVLVWFRGVRAAAPLFAVPGLGWF